MKKLLKLPKPPKQQNPQKLRQKLQKLQKLQNLQIRKKKNNLWNFLLIKQKPLKLFIRRKLICELRKKTFNSKLNKFLRK